jgi:hypothetical protein
MNKLFVNEKKKKIKMKKDALEPVNYEEERQKDPKYKTELCKSWIETNFCVYGNKCRFAHGNHELNNKEFNSNYKKKPCSSFLKYGFCPYGKRCNFKHDERKLTDIILPYFYIQLFIKNCIHCGKRLKIFEEITNGDINSDSTLSESELYSNNNSNNNTPKKIYFSNNYNYSILNNNTKLFTNDEKNMGCLNFMDI